MTTSPMPFLYELEQGHDGPAIPAVKRAYFQQRFRNNMFNFLVDKFELARGRGLTKAALARRISKSPEQITRWLGSPSNLTLDVASELLLGICAEEFVPSSTGIIGKRPSNYSKFAELWAEGLAYERKSAAVPPETAQQTPRETEAASSNYDEQRTGRGSAALAYEGGFR